MSWRILLTGLIAASLCFAQPALAQGNGNGSENGNSNGNGNSGGGNGNANGGDNGNAGGSSGNSSNAGGNGNSNAGGNGNGNAGGNGNENAGGNGNANAGGNGQSSQIGNGNTGRPDSAAPSPNLDSVPNTPAINPRAPVPAAPGQSEETALDAVQAGKAVPLTTIVDELETRAAGEIIDAQLLTVSGFLLYAVKVLSADGRVSTEYYYARTGRRVEVD